MSTPPSPSTPVPSTPQKGPLPSPLKTPSPSPRKALFSASPSPMTPRKPPSSKRTRELERKVLFVHRKKRQFIVVMLLSALASLWLVAQLSIVGWIAVKVDRGLEQKSGKQGMQHQPQPPSHHHPENIMIRGRQPPIHGKTEGTTSDRGQGAVPDGNDGLDESASDPKLIHIVHTRFMQHQTNLTTLGVARLQQFLAFCLPTMVHQSTQDFFWIIKVDPMLEHHAESSGKVFQPLLEAIEGANRRNNNHNIYLVGSNYNYNLQGQGSWRDGKEGEELMPLSQNTVSIADDNALSSSTETPAPGSARVYSGNLAKLKRAYELREDLPVLETRLDADDGLHSRYLERIQTMALKRFLGQGISQVDGEAPPKPLWLYWCIRTQIEWHSESNRQYLNRNDVPKSRSKLPMYHGNTTLGYLGVIQNDQYCITPGITVGYGVGLAKANRTVPRYQHTQLWASLHGKYKFCHSDEDRDRSHKGPCLELVGGTQEERNEQRHKGEHPVVLHALRSRTLTSAGMSGILPSGANNDIPSSARDANIQKMSARMQELMWKILVMEFGLYPPMVRDTQAYLLQNRREIAYQNSLGQCTAGHSCKNQARARLNEVLRQN